MRKRNLEGVAQRELWQKDYGVYRDICRNRAARIRIEAFDLGLRKFFSGRLLEAALEKDSGGKR